MVDRGDFFILTPPPSSGGGAGTNVGVPANATVIVARAVDADFDVTYVDDNNVLVEFPPSVGVDDMLDMSNQLNYVFGVPSAETLGYLTVTAKGILGLADTSDAGPDPDYIPVVGTVTFTPGLSKPIRLIDSASIFAPAPFTTTFDSDGELAYDGVKNVRIVAPLWTNLSKTDWKWTADIRPGPGQSWPAFTVVFTGAPGVVVNLASGL